MIDCCCCVVVLLCAVKIGSLVLFVHDIADVVGYSIKASVDTQYTKVTLTLYVSLLVVWGFTRLYVFPVYVLGSIFYGMSHLLSLALTLGRIANACCFMHVESNRIEHEQRVWN